LRSVRGPRRRAAAGSCSKTQACIRRRELAEQGWLQRRFVGPSDVMSWWWSPQAETALAINALTSAEGPHN
jgi:hypothetical protein